MCLCFWQQNNDWGLVEKLGMGTMVGLFEKVKFGITALDFSTELFAFILKVVSWLKGRKIQVILDWDFPKL